MQNPAESMGPHLENKSISVECEHCGHSLFIIDNDFYTRYCYKCGHPLDDVYPEITCELCQIYPDLCRNCDKFKNFTLKIDFAKELDDDYLALSREILEKELDKMDDMHCWALTRLINMAEFHLDIVDTNLSQLKTFEVALLGEGNAE